MIKTIIFDLGGVYLKGFSGVEKYLEPILGIKAEDIMAKLKGEELTLLFNHGQLTEEEYWSRIIKKNKWDISIDQCKKAIRDNFEEIHGMRKLIESLKKKGFKLGLLSVHAREWIDYCNKKFDYHKLFHSTLYSFEVAISKPDKKAYKLILEKLGSEPSECIFIDDKQKNLIPAEQLGIKTILFKDVNQLKKDLIKLGVKL